MKKYIIIFAILLCAGVAIASMDMDMEMDWDTTTGDGGEGGPDVGSGLLLEDADFLILETSSYLLLE